MLYPNYLKAAYKHLNICFYLLEKPELKKEEKLTEADLLEIYYLAGYVAECLIVYTIYYVGFWNPIGMKPNGYYTNERTGKKEKFTMNDIVEANQKLCIKEYFDPVFSAHYNYDFYSKPLDYNRKVHRLILSCKQENDKKIFSETLIDNVSYRYKYFDKALDTNTIPQSERDINNGYNKCSVHTHDWQNALEKIIPKILNKDGINTTPLGTNSFSKILKNWKPEIRYISEIKDWENVKTEEIIKILTEEKLKELLEDLYNLYNHVKNLKKNHIKG